MGLSIQGTLTGIPIETMTSAEAGNADAQYAVGLMYYEGKSVARNFGEVVKWWGRAAQQGHIPAQCYLGHVYFKGGNGIAKNLQEAAKWWGKAAEAGHTGAQYCLGFNCFKQIGTSNALKWSHSAADHGVCEAQAWLSVLYFCGVGVPSDKIAAYKWLIVANKNHPRIPQRILYVLMRLFLTSYQAGEARRLASEWKPIVETKP